MSKRGKKPTVIQVRNAVKQHNKKVTIKLTKPDGRYKKKAELMNALSRSFYSKKGVRYTAIRTVEGRRPVRG